MIALIIGNAAGVPTARGIVRFPSMMATFTAKTVYSCVFVGGQTDDHCVELARQNPPIASSVIDRGGKLVTSKAFGATRTARFVDAKHGCLLE